MSILNMCAQYTFVSNYKKFTVFFIVTALLSDIAASIQNSNSNGPTFYKTLLYGEKLKGFISIFPADDNGTTYFVSFDIKEKPNVELTWSVHTSSAPYDMAVMTDNCRRVKKSPPIVKNKHMNDSTILANGLTGNTLVVSGANSEVLACATIILPGTELMRATFHSDPIEGHIHIISIERNSVRLVPDLKYKGKYDTSEPEKKIMSWAFVETCTKNATRYTDYSEIGIDSRATFTYRFENNQKLNYLAIYVNDELFECSAIEYVEERTLKVFDVTLMQKHYFEPVRSLYKTPLELHIRDDCLDISTEVIHSNYETYYPSVNIFGSDSIMFKSLVLNNNCKPLRPRFGRPSAIGRFLHPVNGRVSLVDSDDKVLLTGDLRNLIDDESTRATVIILKDKLKSSNCSEIAYCSSCHKVENSAVVVGKNSPQVSLNGVFEWFNISTVSSILIELDGMRVCTNLTVLPTGALSMHALIKKVNLYQPKTAASIVALEYPANNYTEIIINKKDNFSNAEAFTLPIEKSTTVLNCSEINISKLRNSDSWVHSIEKEFRSDVNDSSILLDDYYVSGTSSIIGQNLIIKRGNEVFCGVFEPLSDRIISLVELKYPFFGYIIFTQYTKSSWNIQLPIVVNYSIDYRPNNTRSDKSNVAISWDIVEPMNNNCADSPLFSYFNAENNNCVRNETSQCDIRNGLNNSTIFIPGNHQINFENISLKGYNSIIGKNMRLRFSNISECFTIRKASEATFRWKVYKRISHHDIQQNITERTDMMKYQVKLDMETEEYGENCKIYRVTILGEDNRLEKILQEFDAERLQFKSEPIINCTTNTISTKHSKKSVVNSSDHYISSSVVTKICALIIFEVSYILLMY